MMLLLSPQPCTHHFEKRSKHNFLELVQENDSKSATYSSKLGLLAIMNHTQESNPSLTILWPNGTLMKHPSYI